MKVQDIRLAKGGLSDEIYAGTLNKDGQSWKEKTNVTADFLTCVIQRWENETEIIQSGEDKWEITVKKIN